MQARLIWFGRDSLGVRVPKFCHRRHDSVDER
jgi:hypothetical protein